MVKIILGFETTPREIGKKELEPIVFRRDDEDKEKQAKFKQYSNKLQDKGNPNLNTPNLQRIEYECILELESKAAGINSREVKDLNQLALKYYHKYGCKLYWM